MIKEEQRMAINDTLEDPVVLISNNIFKRPTTCLKYLQVDKQFGSIHECKAIYLIILLLLGIL